MRYFHKHEFNALKPFSYIARRGPRKPCVDGGLLSGAPPRPLAAQSLRYISSAWHRISRRRDEAVMNIDVMPARMSQTELDDLARAIHLLERRSLAAR